MQTLIRTEPLPTRVPMKLPPLTASKPVPSHLLSDLPRPEHHVPSPIFLPGAIPDAPSEAQPSFSPVTNPPAQLGPLGAAANEGEEELAFQRRVAALDEQADVALAQTNVAATAAVGSADDWSMPVSGGRREFSILCATWNLGGQRATSKLDSLLRPGRYDIYAVGTQESCSSIPRAVMLPASKQAWEASLADCVGESALSVLDATPSRNLGLARGV